VGGVVFMNALPSLVQQAVREKPFQDYMAKSGDLWNRHTEAVSAWEKAHPPPPPAFAQYFVAERGALRYGHARYFDWWARHESMSVEGVLAYSEADYELLMDNQRALANEALYVDDLSILSPVTNYQVLAYTLARTTIRDMWVLREEGQRYRAAYFEHLRRSGVIGSWRWFTDDRPGEAGIVEAPESATPEMLAPDSGYMRTRQAWVRQREAEAARSPRTLDLSALPPFPGVGRRSLAQSLARMTPGLAVMVLTLGLVLLAATARFLRDEAT
jgi:hypothetical protein